MSAGAGDQVRAFGLSVGYITSARRARRVAIRRQPPAKNLDDQLAQRRSLVERRAPQLPLHAVIAQVDVERDRRLGTHQNLPAETLRTSYHYRCQGGFPL